MIPLLAKNSIDKKDKVLKTVTSNDAQKKQAHFFLSILASIKDGISVSDTEMNILYVNPIMEEWYSHTLPLIGKKCYTAYHGRNKPCCPC
jgi:PAS domain-containing protein